MDAERREFIRSAARAVADGALVSFAVPLLESCGESAQTRYETTVDVASLTRDGQTLIAPSAGVDGAPIIVVRLSVRRYLAMSMQCTHEGCPVDPPVGELITCPCHGSQYDLEGRVRRGPSQFPLARYDTRLEAKTKRLVVRV